MGLMSHKVVSHGAAGLGGRHLGRRGGRKQRAHRSDGEDGGRRLGRHRGMDETRMRRRRTHRPITGRQMRMCRGEGLYDGGGGMARPVIAGKPGDISGCNLPPPVSPEGGEA